MHWIVIAFCFKNSSLQYDDAFLICPALVSTIPVSDSDKIGAGIK